VSIPADKNASVKDVEKLSKYKDLEIEIERMWGMKTTAAPVVILALDITKKGTEQCINNKKNPREHQTTRASENNTAHILRKVLAVKWSCNIPGPWSGPGYARNSKKDS